MATSWLTGKSVLVTGASGTVATGLITQVLATQPRNDSVYPSPC